jgi:hypothetical protein
MHGCQFNEPDAAIVEVSAQDALKYKNVMGQMHNLKAECGDVYAVQMYADVNWVKGISDAELEKLGASPVVPISEERYKELLDTRQTSLEVNSASSYAFVTDTYVFWRSDLEGQVGYLETAATSSTIRRA